MVGLNLKCDLGTCLGMICTKDGTDKAGISTINLIFDNKVGFKYEQIMKTTTLDRASKGRAKESNQDKEIRDTNDCDKIGK